MDRKTLKTILAIALAVLVLICAAESVYKTWEAEKKRREAVRKQEDEPVCD
ncbi:MAG: hypothetical protein K6A33_13735 [Clostridiales bacterium]|nr:hypothetical protein [Clostridiales bacterium]